MFKKNIRSSVMIIALAVVTILFEFLTGGVLLKPLNISNLIMQNAYILILSIGMLLAILTGGNIDLSVGSVAGFVGAISAVLVVSLGMPVLWAIIISLFCRISYRCMAGVLDWLTEAFRLLSPLWRACLSLEV